MKLMSYLSQFWKKESSLGNYFLLAAFKHSSSQLVSESPPQKVFISQFVTSVVTFARVQKWVSSEYENVCLYDIKIIAPLELLFLLLLLRRCVKIHWSKKSCLPIADAIKASCQKSLSLKSSFAEGEADSNAVSRGAPVICIGPFFSLSCFNIAGIFHVTHDRWQIAW